LVADIDFGSGKILSSLIFYNYLNHNPDQRKSNMPTENFYDLYITDQDRKIILEERTVNADTAERIIRDYSWRENPQSHAQFWKHHTKFSLTINFVESTKAFQVGFSDKASRFKLPLPYVGATYGLLSEIDQVIESLRLFLGGEFKKLEQFLAKFRPEQKGDEVPSETT